MRKTILLVLLALYSSTGIIQAQDNWKLKTDKDGIRVYMKSMPNSKIKAIKVECFLQTSLSQLVAVIFDINATKDWVYSTKSATVIKNVSPADLYYYSEIAVPWPVSNRDFVCRITAVQNPVTKVVTVDATNAPTLVPEKPGIVRVPESTGKWIITPVDKSKVSLEYTLFVNPGGAIPSWLINLFAAKGPMESFQKIQEQVRKPQYNNVHPSFIKE